MHSISVSEFRCLMESMLFMVTIAFLAPLIFLTMLNWALQQMQIWLEELGLRLLLKGRCYESHGEDTDVVWKMTSIVTDLQEQVPQGYPKGYPYVAGRNKVVACAKHFVGDGGTDKGINEGNTIASYDKLERIHMIMVPHKYEKFLEDLTSFVETGENIYDHVTKAFCTLISEHRELACKAVRKSLVLLVVVSLLIGTAEEAAGPGTSYGAN
ncbi:hypothetical protein RJ641_032785 [Dillenia turbinata]|uniref:Glycoside hydrolase family 3 N-terminal domain-containing protein n=1 Tax=Dillenia turbinata TaxID=194707 RepID=A0AAN8VKB8_9MAGN